jgi:hypothetical protein
LEELQAWDKGQSLPLEQVHCPEDEPAEAQVKPVPHGASQRPQLSSSLERSLQPSTVLLHHTKLGEVALQRWWRQLGSAQSVSPSQSLSTPS